MAEPDIVVKAWARQAVIALAAVVVTVFGVISQVDSRYVNKREHEEHEANDRQEVARIDRTLAQHMESTRLDAVRLATIEAQLAVIQKQLERMEVKFDRAAAIKTQRVFP